jgi:hypothetical protein
MYKSNGVEWAQPQRAIGVRGHGGEVAGEALISAPQ